MQMTPCRIPKAGTDKERETNWVHSRENSERLFLGAGHDNLSYLRAAELEITSPTLFDALEVTA